MAHPTPDWKTNFKDLPEIPASKRWTESTWTPEQEITKRLIDKEPVNADEIKTLEQAIAFYEDLMPKLSKISVADLNSEEIAELTGYFEYAFNHILMVRNELHVTGIFRLVKNASVPTEKGKVRHAKYLSYPPLELVKEKQLYNRANTPEYNLFYATDSIDSALLELKPKAGEYVSLGTWVPKEGNTTLTAYPITHNPLAIQVNREAQNGYRSFQELKQKNDPTLMKFMEVIFTFISYQFAKPVDNPLEYFFSAKFAGRILHVRHQQEEWNYDCIAYPSVGNKYSVDNLAILPEVIDEKFKLAHVLHFKVEETYYDKVPSRNNPQEITVVKYDEKETTDWIDNDDIVW